MSTQYLRLFPLLHRTAYIHNNTHMHEITRQKKENHFKIKSKSYSRGKNKHALVSHSVKYSSKIWCQVSWIKCKKLLTLEMRCWSISRKNTNLRSVPQYVPYSERNIPTHCRNSNFFLCSVARSHLMPFIVVIFKVTIVQNFSLSFIGFSLPPSLLDVIFMLVFVFILRNGMTYWIGNGRTEVRGQQMERHRNEWVHLWGS